VPVRGHEKEDVTHGGEDASGTTTKPSVLA
jgi:hypothetical protein